MSQINLNSISGITSITTPAGVDNQLTIHTNDTTERFKIDGVGNLHSNGKLTINPDDGTTTWKRENKNMHQIRDDVYIEGTVNVGDKAGFDATPLGITSFTWVSAGTSYYSLTTNAHAIPQGTNVLIKDSVSGFQEAYNTTSGAGTTITVERAVDPSSQLSIANTKVVVYTPADPRGCLNVAKDYAKVRENGFNPILRGFVGSSTTHPVGINTEVFKIEIKRDGTVKDSVATLLHSTREMGSKQRLALTIDDGDSYPDGKNLVLTQTGVKITANDSAFSDANALLEVDGNVTIGDYLDVGSNIKIGNAGVITATSYNGSGASLTNLNASNISSGTVPSARLGSGTASSSTFLAGDSTFKTITGTTINSNADTRVITGSGTANTLNAAGNFTHDSSTCDTTIQHYEALKVVDLIVKNTNNHGNAAGARITIESGSAANTGPQFQMICGSHNWSMQVPKAAGNLEFNNNGTLDFLMADDGDFHVVDGDIVFSTAGHGIDFSATSDASGGTSELLDDYEEGLWVPLIRNTSGSGTYGNSNVGSYTKIGNMVHISGTIHWTAMSGTTNWSGVIRNLPFASYSGTGFYRSACVIGATSGITPNNSGSPHLVFIMDAGQGFLYIVGASVTGGGFTHYPTISNAGSIYGFDLSYRVS